MYVVLFRGQEIINVPTAINCYVNWKLITLIPDQGWVSRDIFTTAVYGYIPMWTFVACFHTFQVESSLFGCHKFDIFAQRYSFPTDLFFSIYVAQGFLFSFQIAFMCCFCRVCVHACMYVHCWCVSKELYILDDDTNRRTWNFESGLRFFPE
jgi:hypothetical protein